MLSILIPVYNEGDNIVHTFNELKLKVRTPHNIYIIYDFDEDNTVPAVQNYIVQNNSDNIFFIKNIYGKGVLNAIKTGFDSIKGGTILVAMADLSDDFAVVDSMYEKIKQGNDIVCGSRYMKGGKQIGGPRIKGLLSRTAGISLHHLIGIPTHDISNSFKMYRKGVLDNILLESSAGFEIGMEIVVKSYLKGYKIAEVPSIWRDRTAGKSNFKLAKWLPKYIGWYTYAVTYQIKKKVRLSD